MRVERLATTVGRFLEAEFVEHGDDRAPVGRLIEGASQVADRRVRGAARIGLAGSRTQHLDAGGLTRPRERQQAASDLLAVGPAHLHQLGGASVQSLALDHRGLVVDRGADDRVHEVELVIGDDHIDRRQRVDGRADRVPVQARQADHVFERHRRTEHRDRPRHRGRGIRQRSQSAADRAPDSLGPELDHSRRVSHRSGQPMLGELRDQLSE